MKCLWLLLLVAHAAPDCRRTAASLAALRAPALTTLCAAKSRYLAAAQARRRDFMTIFREGVRSGRRVVLLGVEHFNFEDRLYPRFAAEARRANPAVDCFFVEDELSAPEARAALTAFNAGDDRRWTPEVTLLSQSTLDRLTRIRDAGLKIHFVDRPGYISDEDARDPRKSDAWARARNRAMAEAIVKLMKPGGGCHAALYPVGALHLSDGHRPTLPRRLKRSRIATDAMALVIAGRNSRDDEGPRENGTWTWSAAGKRLCANDPPVPTASFGFINARTPMPAYYDGRFAIDYADFSRTLVYVDER